MTTPLPTKFKIACTADGAPAAGLLVLVSLGTNRKNPFTAIVGPTDANGSVAVTGAFLEQEAAAARAMFPSDYEPPSAFSGVIDVRPMSLDQIESAIQAYRLYSGVTTTPAAYPPGYLKQLTDGFAALERLAPRRLDAAVSDVEPPFGSVRFTTQSVPYPAAHPAPAH